MSIKINEGSRDISFAFLGGIQIFPNEGFTFPIPVCPTQIVSTNNSTGIQTLVPSTGIGWYRDYGISPGYVTGTAPDGNNYMTYGNTIAKIFVLVGTPVPFRWRLTVGTSISDGNELVDGVYYPVSGIANATVTLSYPAICPVYEFWRTELYLCSIAPTPSCSYLSPGPIIRILQGQFVGFFIYSGRPCAKSNQTTNPGPGNYYDISGGIINYGSCSAACDAA